MTTLILVVGIALAVSFLCSILEAVFLSVTHSYVAMLKERDEKLGGALARMRLHIDEPIAAILTLNTIAHTAGAAIGGAVALTVFGDKWIALFSVVLTIVILVFSEIIPKTLGATFWQQLAPVTTQTLRVLILILKPILVPLGMFSRAITPKNVRGSTVSRGELEILAEIGRREGTIDEDEWQVVSNVMNLGEVRVGDVMTPRISITGLPVEYTLQQAQDTMLDDGHLRMPVYSEDIDQVVGIVLARDLWQAARDKRGTLRDIMRAPVFVPATKPVDVMIEEMRRQRLQMAIVLDEYGGTAGLVTLEDLIEEIVGEIQDEHERDPLPFERGITGEINVSGAVSLDEMNERFDLELPDDTYDTLGGFVFGELSRIPEVGDEVSFNGGKLRVVSMDERRIERLAFIPGRRSEDPGDN
jgi:putative hemolysin